MFQRKASHRRVKSNFPPIIPRRLARITNLKPRWRTVQAGVVFALLCLVIWYFFRPGDVQKPAPNIASTGSRLRDGRPAHIADVVAQQYAQPVPPIAVPESEDAKTDITFPTHPENPSIAQYVHAILDVNDMTFPKMSCPTTIGARYTDLARREGRKVHYFLALNLYQVAPLLPRLIGTIIETIKFLGPEQCALSIIEGRSDDNTFEILAGLREELGKLGTHYYLSSSTINPHGEGTERISALSELRNMALAPLLEDTTLYSHDTVITFINDIAICPDDILELLYQHKYQGATQTCSWDWIHDGACFYDVWVSRSMVGNIFFEVTQDASWAYLDNLFWDDAVSKDKFARVQPLQVYACWGGMVTLDAKMFVDKQVAFRASREGECYMGEPTTLAKDMWGLGIARIVAVPSVNVGYSNEEGAKIKVRRGYVGDHVDTSKPPEERQTELLEWKTTPPGHLKCLPVWGQPSWVSPI